MYACSKCSVLNTLKKVVAIAKVMKHILKHNYTLVICHLTSISRMESPERSGYVPEADFHERLRPKQRQRLVEYAILIALQILLATAFVREARFLFALGLSVSALGMAWTLAHIREARRTLNVHSTKRLIGDTLESFGIMMLLALSGIAARWLEVPRMSFMAHLSLVVAAYFVGSLMGELRWRKRFLHRLSHEEQQQYLVNLNRSVIFPYNLAYLRETFFGNSRKPRS